MVVRTYDSFVHDCPLTTNRKHITSICAHLVIPTLDCTISGIQDWKEKEENIY